MKIEINYDKIEKRYPWLGITKDGVLVLFTSRDTGVCLKGGSDNVVGDNADNWSELELFKPFNGTITFSND